MNITTERLRAVVIGGGPGGLMAAEHLARAGHPVTLFERMPSLARKFLLAGRGGLNLTHSEPLPAFLARYGAAREALAPAIDAFPPEALQAWSADLGEPTFVGSSGRVFPEHFKTSPLLRAWLRRLGDANVAVRVRHRFVGWSEEGALRFDTPEGRVQVRADAVVLALGGASWPRLGSDGAWVPVLAEQGVEIAPLRPANCGFDIAWSSHLTDRFAGTPLKSIALSHAGRSVRGEAMITAGGLEGGAVYALSGPLRDAIARDGTATLHIDLKPDLAHADLVLRLAKPRHGQSAATFLRKATGLSPVAIALLREAGPLPAEADALATRIKALPLVLLAPRPIERAISSAGGLRFEETDTALMLTRRPGTFVAGEMLDWEAPTGGYLLQACFATGAMAGRAAADWLGAP